MAPGATAACRLQGAPPVLARRSARLHVLCARMQIQGRKRHRCQEEFVSDKRGRGRLLQLGEGGREGRDSDFFTVR